MMSRVMRGAARALPVVERAIPVVSRGRWSALSVALLLGMALALAILVVAMPSLRDRRGQPRGLLLRQLQGQAAPDAALPPGRLQGARGLRAVGGQAAESGFVPKPETGDVVNKCSIENTAPRPEP